MRGIARVFVIHETHQENQNTHTRGHNHTRQHTLVTRSCEVPQANSSLTHGPLTEENNGVSGTLREQSHSPTLQVDTEIKLLLYCVVI